MKILIPYKGKDGKVLNSFEGHKGRPSEVGGSLPKNSTELDDAESRLKSVKEKFSVVADKYKDYKDSSGNSANHPEVEKALDEVLSARNAINIARLHRDAGDDAVRLDTPELMKILKPIQDLAGGYDKTEEEKGWFTPNVRWGRGKQIGESCNLGKEYEAVPKSGGNGVLFRGVSVDDWNRMQKNGYVDTDMRDAIDRDEGMNLSPDVRTAASYLPMRSEGVILAMKTDHAKLFKIEPDEYIRTKDKIPLSDVLAVSPVIGRHDDVDYYIHQKRDEKIKNSFNPDEPEYRIKTDANKVTFEAGGRPFSGKVVEPFPLPLKIPISPYDVNNKNSYMETIGGQERLFIDFLARRMWFLEKAKPGQEKEQSLDGWVVKSGGSWYPKANTKVGDDGSDVAARPALPDDVAGSLAYVKRLGLTYATGSAYDADINIGYEHKDELNEMEKDITNPNNIPAGVDGVFRYEGKMEARALDGRCKLPPVEDLIAKEKSESLSDKSKEYFAAKYAKIKEAYAKVLEMSRGDALEYLSDSKARAERKNEKQFQEASKRIEAIPHADEKGWENVSAAWKEYFHNNTLAAKSNAFSVIKDAVKKDFIQSLVPNYSTLKPSEAIAYPMTIAEGIQKSIPDLKTASAFAFINAHVNPATREDMNAKPIGINWRPSLVGEGGIHAYDRSYYSSSQKEIVMRPDADDTVVAHEIGHHLAQVTFGDNYGRDFIYDRAERTTQPLRRMTGDLGYTAEEVAHADRFINPYVGKEYPGSSTEVVSMGIEHMMRDPQWFYEHDREHFLFTKYVMDGGLRKGYNKDNKLTNSNPHPMGYPNERIHAENLDVYHGTSKEHGNIIKQDGLKPGVAAGMSAASADQENPFVFVTSKKSGAEWYAKNNLRIKDGGAVVGGKFTGDIYKVSNPTSDYGAMAELHQHLGGKLQGIGIVPLNDLADRMRKNGVGGIHYKDKYSNREAIAALPEFANFKISSNEH